MFRNPLSLVMVALILIGQGLFAGEKNANSAQQLLQELKAHGKEFSELYQQEFKKLYDPNSKVEDTVAAAIDQAKPLIDSLIVAIAADASTAPPVVTKDLTQLRKYIARGLIRRALDQAKPAIDAYAQQGRALYWGTDSEIATQMRKAFDKGKEAVQNSGKIDPEQIKQALELLGRQAREQKATAQKQLKDFTTAYKAAFSQDYVGPDSKLSQVTEVAIEKAKPYLDAYVQEFLRDYKGKDSRAAEAVRYAVKRAKPVIDAYATQFKSTYIGNDSTVATLARAGVAKAKDFTEQYKLQFMKDYVGPDSRLSELTGVAIEKAKPLIDGYVQEFKRDYWGDDSRAADALRYAVQKAKPAIDAYTAEFRKTYLEDNSRAAQLARKALRQGKTFAKDYADQLDIYYGGSDSVVGNMLKSAYREAKPLGEAYGYQFKKLYVGKDATAWKKTKKIGQRIHDFATKKVIPTLSDWVNWRKDEVEALGSGVASPLIQTAMLDENEPINVASKGVKLAMPIDKLSQLIAAQQNVNEVEPQRLAVLEQPDGFGVATYGLTPIAAATMACNPTMVQQLLADGASLQDHPVILTALSDRNAYSKLSGLPQDLIRFRLFVLKQYLESQAGDTGVARAKYNRCLMTQTVLDEALHGPPGNHYSDVLGTAQPNHYK